jgi:hypothetical protein
MVFHEAPSQSEGSRILIRYFGPKPHTQLQNPGEFLRPERPAVTVALPVCGKVVRNIMLTPVGVCEDMIRAPFLTTPDLFPADVTAARCLLQDNMALDRRQAAP